MVEMSIPQVCLVSANRIGKFKQGNHRPIRIKLIAFRWKRTFFEKAKTFKKFGFKITNDMSKKEKELLKSLFVAKKLLKNQGNHNAYIKGTNLYLNNKLVTNFELNGILNSNPYHVQNKKKIAARMVHIKSHNSLQDGKGQYLACNCRLKQE
ncbi:uncharacterized protein LOC127282530 [Leptopilina boulardi]|uniref:uncharacterized protein LOC127282530 n=1 Tax=Leptopilina boulardi TaxID=63433 RepID=UPI0021F60077|nr:uncharacterized protein LOC127282530 [Leptopilina boulardi]